MVYPKNALPFARVRDSERAIKLKNLQAPLKYHAADQLFQVATILIVVFTLGSLFSGQSTFTQRGSSSGSFLESAA